MYLVNKKTEKVDIRYPVTYFPCVSLTRCHSFIQLSNRLLDNKMNHRNQETNQKPKLRVNKKNN